jgi:hypothetical protein
MGKHYVQDDEVGVVPGNSLQSGLPILGLLHPIALAFQVQTRQLEDVGFVIDE